jgi:hypothetical protein
MKSDAESKTLLSKKTSRPINQSTPHHVITISTSITFHEQLTTSSSSLDKEETYDNVCVEGFDNSKHVHVNRKSCHKDENVNIIVIF